jgi:hypothetical protein
MVQWSNLEIILALWFRAAAAMPVIDMAQAIFFSARSFQGRSEMLAAVIGIVPDDVEFKPLLQEGLLKAIGYNSVRNQIAHGTVHGGQDATVRSGDKWLAPGDITLEHLENAAANFAELRRILYQGLMCFYKDKKRGKPIPECLERLRRLPNEACSKEPSQRQRGRERQRQSALRSKGKPQA